MKNTLGFSSKNVCCSMAQQLSSSCLYLPHSIMIKLKYSEELLHMYVPASICRIFDGGTPHCMFPRQSVVFLTEGRHSCLPIANVIISFQKTKIYAKSKPRC